MGLVMTVEDLIERERMLNRFNRLISELLRGSMVRNTFHPWEIELLLDIEGCAIDLKRKSETLRRYQKAVERQLECGPGPPMKLSEFLQARSTRRPSIA
jgi:hypothetical protein